MKTFELLCVSDDSFIKLNVEMLIKWIRSAAPEIKIEADAENTTSITHASVCRLNCADTDTSPYYNLIKRTVLLWCIHQNFDIDVQ